jgi:hypothetical protein
MSADAASLTASVPRRQFRLPAEDEEFLNGLGFFWEAVIDQNIRWVIVYRVPLPTGFTVAIANVAFQIAPAYPPGALDMAYFEPPLARADGKTIPNLSTLQLESRSWQQWSRHRDAAVNPWVDGEDTFGSHYLYMQSWLAAEPKR